MKIQNDFFKIIALMVILTGEFANESITAQAKEDIVINEINFPDEAFREYISRNIDVNADGCLDEAEILAVNQIPIEAPKDEWFDIKSFEGLQYFEKLEKFSCDYLKINNLDLSNNTALISVSCNQNQLSSLDVTHNDKLTYLSCVGNNLTSLDVSNNIALNELECWSNQITELDTGKNIELRKLNCEINKIENLFIGSSKLEELSCSTNQIKSLDLSNNPDLIKLSCYNNQLKSLDVKNNKKLTFLQCSKNQLTNLDVSKNTNLKTLSCQNNQLESLDISNCTILIITKQNGITKEYGTGVIHYETNGGDTQITYDEHTQLIEDNRTIPYGEGDLEISEVSFPDEIFRGYIKKEFDLDGNGYLSQYELEKVTDISLMGYTTQNITSISGVEYFVNLTRLNCNNNEIENLDISKNVLLETLMCSRNNLSKLDVRQNKALRSIYCDSNKLKQLDLTENKSLNVLSCTNNRLSALNLSENELLRTLTCDSNKISELQLNNKTFLTELSCKDNQLNVLDITNDTRIKRITCDNNLLTDMDLSSNSDLQYLYCNNNQLKSLDISYNNSLAELNAQNNCLQELVIGNKNKSITIDCRNNKIVDLKLENCIGLSTLNCSNNTISKINLSKCLNLTSVDCSDNQITSLKLGENNVLKYLNCRNNQLSELKIGKNTQLNTLDCSNNKLTGLDISNNLLLNILRCEKNMIEFIDISNCSGLIKAVEQGKKTIQSGITSFVTKDEELSCDERMGVLDNRSEIEDEEDKNGVYINESNFPDEIFRKYVINNFDKNRDNILSQEEINKIENVNLSCTNASGGELESLKGIEYFEKLQTLYCENNKLEELDLSRNLELKNLNCHGNKLKNLDVSKNSKLSVLDCGFNGLLKLDLKTNIVLNQVNCRSNQLSTLDVSNNVDLVELDCGYNKLTKLNLNNNKNLVSLVCDTNQLSSMDVTNNYELKTLRCYSNLLSELDISNCINLVAIIQDNQASVKNGIISYGGNGSDLAIDQKVQLKIARVNIDQNTFPDSIFRAYIHTYCDTNHDKMLSISELSAVKTINCAGDSKVKISERNGITTLKGIEYFENLEVLQCENNCIRELDISQNTSLKKLICYSNYISKIDVSNCIKLVNAVKNGITPAYVNPYKHGDLYEASGAKLECDYKVKVIIDTCPFSDVSENDWFFEAVQFVRSLGIMNGTSKTSFRPNDVLTRSQFITVIYNMEGKPNVGFKKIFDDVNDPDAWYALPVTWAYRNNITKGIGNNMFGTNVAITREQLATLLYNYAQKKTEYNLSIDENLVANFPDADRISVWADQGMKWAITNGVLSGKPKAGKNYLDPQGMATRAECAQMIKNLKQNANSK